MTKPRSSKSYILIIDSSTLIVLRELGAERLLDNLRARGIAEIIIPEAVVREFARAGITIKTYSPPPQLDKEPPLPEVPRSLGEGELEAIGVALSLAGTHQAEPIVVTDDKKARRACRRLGLQVIGTLGLVELAKKHGVIAKDEALELMDRIPETSLYATPQILEEAKTKIEQQC